LTCRARRACCTASQSKGICHGSCGTCHARRRRLIAVLPRLAQRTRGGSSTGERAGDPACATYHAVGLPCHVLVLARRARCTRHRRRCTALPSHARRARAGTTARQCVRHRSGCARPAFHRGRRAVLTCRARRACCTASQSKGICHGSCGTCHARRRRLSAVLSRLTCRAR
jgi:hypothetical protein